MWYRSPKALAWIASNPPVQNWLDRISSHETRSTYGQCLQAFCEWTRKTPEQLLEMRRKELKSDSEEAKFATLNLLQSFILKGTYSDKRRGHEGRIANVGESGKKRRESFYISVRSFFMHNRLPLPDDPSFKIRDNDKTPRLTFMPLAQARAIIGALKDPYRTIFTAALYGGMGRDELLMLNESWPSIRKQLVDGKDPIRIDFSRRKSNQKPFFTLVPAKILKPFEKAEENPFQGVARIKGYPKSSPKILRPVKDYDLNVAWRFARKRASIKEPYTGHMLRDLFITLGYKVGMRKETSDFLLGHTVDELNYLQIIHEPETVTKEWQKLRLFLDSGIDTETRDEIELLRTKVKEQEARLEKLEATSVERLLLAAKPSRRKTQKGS